MHIVNAKQIHSDQVELVPNERRKCPQPLPVALHFQPVRLRFLTGNNPSCAAVCVGTVGLLRFVKGKFPLVRPTLDFQPYRYPSSLLFTDLNVKINVKLPLGVWRSSCDS